MFFLGRPAPAMLLQVIAQPVMTCIFVTLNTGVIVRFIEIPAMGTKGAPIALRGLAQILMALEATRVIDIFFPALTYAVPVDLVRLLEHRHRRVDNAVPGLHNEIVQRVIMGQVAVVAGSPESRLVVAAVGTLAVSRSNRLIGMAVGAEFIICGGVKGGIEQGPACNREYTRSGESGAQGG